MTFPEAVSVRGKRPDLLFCQSRRDVLHVIEVEPTLERAFDKAHGFAQLKKYKGNYKWLALPRDEWEKDVDYSIDKKCNRRGIGLLLVSGTKTLRVIEEIQPSYIPGDFLGYYPKAEEYWYE